MKSILITGASRGIGKATALKFLENGWKVYGTYFNSFSNIKDLIDKYANFVPIGPYDFSDLKQTHKFVDDMKQYRFDALFLNAGIFSDNDDFLNFNLKDFQKVMHCNFYSPMIIAIGLQNNINTFGSIVFMSSNDSFSGAFTSISYSSSKGAILNVMKSLAVNYGKKGIRVNSIAPGAIDTDMNTPEQVNESPKWTPLSRVAQPYEVANVVYFLSGPESSFVNGENITIDGGYGNVSILLQKEMEANRVYGGYNEIIKRYNNLKKSDQILSVDVADNGYAWEDNNDERKYLDAIVSAQNRGVQVYRFIVLPETRIENFKNCGLFKEYKPKLKNVYILSKNQLRKGFNDIYQILGQGCDIMVNKKGEKSSFIDFYADNNCVGVLTKNEQITNHLFDKIMKLKQLCEDKKIKIY